MAVSKRLRFEILRRDNHQCRYCGAKPAERELRVDHVIPVALGGDDNPANLVAACDPCNSGKSSVPVDAPLVAAVADDALRMAKALELVAEQRAAERKETEAIYRKFKKEWRSWSSTDWRGEKRYAELPGDWRRSIDQFLDAGLTLDDLVQMAGVALGGRNRGEWRYFCGCCWNLVRDIQNRAAKIASSAPVHAANVATDDTLTTRLTRTQFKSSLKWMTNELVRISQTSSETVLDLNNYSCIHEDNLAECGDPVCAYIAAAEFLVGAYMIVPSPTEEQQEARGWFKSVWYNTAWKAGHRAWKNIHPDSLDDAREYAQSEGLTPEDHSYVDDFDRLYTTDAPRPREFFDDVDHFQWKGLTRSQIERNVVEAMSAPIDRVDLWSYFRGCCWRDLRAKEAAV